MNKQPNASGPSKNDLQKDEPARSKPAKPGPAETAKEDTPEFDEETGFWFFPEHKEQAKAELAAHPGDEVLWTYFDAHDVERKPRWVTFHDIKHDKQCGFCGFGLQGAEMGSDHSYLVIEPGVYFMGGTNIWLLESEPVSVGRTAPKSGEN
ncbi:hypothetical protein MMC12_005585 [Toensbergia leucococca]|nr:hypothetical protein [Toensbergia leucococca]